MCNCIIFSLMRRTFQIANKTETEIAFHLQKLSSFLSGTFSRSVLHFNFSNFYSSGRISDVSFTVASTRRSFWKRLLLRKMLPAAGFDGYIPLVPASKRLCKRLLTVLTLSICTLLAWRPQPIARACNKHTHEWRIRAVG